ncbi:histone-like nucleoid-structuring protein Lsr2 [Mycolicibacter algericus]|uniref:histone-like nucleoid-structuring protein Lsr2 n=1 Tax=Mycolicibacter algericus TaxID=1288388 RepID=UPI003C71F8A5
MARKVVLIDDLDGESAAAETIYFAIDGTNYEIDLSGSNAKKLRDCLEPFVAAARRTTGHRPPAASFGSYANAAARRHELDEVRNWAKAQGFPVSDRGRIPVSVQEAFDQAHNRT